LEIVVKKKGKVKDPVAKFVLGRKQNKTPVPKSLTPKPKYQKKK